MRVAIVDDEILFEKKLSDIIKERWIDLLESLTIFLSAGNFIKSSEEFDILFLDIEMPGISGIEIAKNYSNTNLQIVFVTNRDDLVFEAYNTTKAIGFVRKSDLINDLSVILNRINSDKTQAHCLSVKVGDAIVKVKYSSIIYIEKVLHNIIIYTPISKYTKRIPISEIEPELTTYGFVRVHSGYIINLEHVVLINPTGAVMSNGTTIPISRSNLKYAKDKFLERSVMFNE